MVNAKKKSKRKFFNKKFKIFELKLKFFQKNNNNIEKK
jgi:hypothetical protein